MPNLPSATDIKLCFDDILLLPRYSELESRNDPKLDTKLGNIILSCPIISAPMDSITGRDMLVAMDAVGGLGILTRYIGNPEETFKQINDIKWAKHNGAKNIGCAIGIREDADQKSQRLLDAGCNVICIDVAHGDHQKMYDSIDKILALKNQYVFTLIAGNVCVPEAARRMSKAGVDVIKVGIGPGAACTTRRVTGFGMPQLSAIIECSKSCEADIIADGGLRTTGDMVKALWAGANACMIGYMLAGTSATPDINGGKVYRGMSSRTVSNRDDIAPEGIDIAVNYRGDTLHQLTGYVKGIRSGLAMGGAMNIEQLRQCESVRVSPLSMTETEPVG